MAHFTTQRHSASTLVGLNYLGGLATFLWLCLMSAQGQNLLTNPGFEAGASQPEGWDLQSGQGQWTQPGYDSSRGVSVTAVNSYWRSTNSAPVQPGETYVVRFKGRGSDSRPFGLYAQLEKIGTRPMVPVEHWASYNYTAVVPNNVTNTYLRVGQGSQTGNFDFDNVELKKAWAVHVRREGCELGAGESVLTNRYYFQTRLEDYRFGNSSRCLYSHTPTLGGYYWEGYWDMKYGDCVSYRHKLGGLDLTNATIKATVSYSTNASLFVEASVDGQNWVEVGKLTPAGTGTGSGALQTNLPASLFPLSEVYVRLLSTGRMNVSRYEFQADVAAQLSDLEGYTWFVEQEVAAAGVEPVSMNRTSSGHELTLKLINTNGITQNLSITCTAEGPSGTRQTQQDIWIPALTTNELAVLLPTAGSGENAVRIQVVEQMAMVFDGTVRVEVAAIQDDFYGYQLDASLECSVWWCEAAYKVARDRELPTTTNTAVEISAARNEYEPFQIVLRPDIGLSNLTVSVSDFNSTESSATIASTNIEVALVDYVPVRTPTDYAGVPGDHPDPLIPLTGPINLTTGTNQPFWFTVFVPKDTPPGEYESAVSFQSDDLLLTVPVHLRVYGFGLSEVTHTRSAYSVRVDPNWHKPANTAQEELIWDYYMQNFRRHRITPYAAHLYSPAEWSVSNGLFQHDFTKFDATMSRYLDEFGFTGFNVMGIKSPSFPQSLEGYQRFTLGFNQRLAGLLQPIMAHLREKGWANKAYIYWTDEPTVSTYPSVIQGMQAIQRAAPGLRRLLTANADAPLHGSVDIWCPFSMSYDYLPTLEDLYSRQAAGDETWWYVAISPKAPAPNNFIDHPAISPRIRTWLSQRYDVTGDLYWDTTEYTSIGGVERNPYEDTMSSSAGGVILGNGDGMLLYPPVKSLPSGPVLSGPINSLRWELIREAMEDGEYFWLLKTMINDALVRVGPDHPSVIQAQAAYQAALDLAPSPKWFERDPRKLYTARDQIAQAIEALDDGSPLIVRHPDSQAVKAGNPVVLHAEALGWPMPDFQWQFNETNIQGAVESSLMLSNFNTLQSGSYRVLASNAHGVVASAVARVVGYDSVVARVVTDPEHLVRLVGESAVLSVTAVSSNPISYLWFHNGEPALASIATNATLLLTNLSLGDAGDYSVAMTTSGGSVTSSLATLTILAPPSDPISLISTGSVWRYYNSDLPPPMNWAQPGFDDSSWSAGLAKLGFGEGDESTVIPPVPGTNPQPTTVYFRHTFQGLASGQSLSLVGRLVRDDGAIVYLNGTEVFRDNLPPGEIGHSTSALSQIEGVDELIDLPFSLPSQLFQPQTNVLAVEIHQCTVTNTSDSGATGYWPFDESDSPWSDRAGTNHFLSNGSTIVGVPGRFGGCVSNSIAGDDYILAPASEELGYSGPFTVGGWFAWDVVTDLPATCIEKQGEFRLYYTGTATNRYRFEVAGVHVQNQTSGTTAGQWRFVVGWFDGTNASIQLDNGAVYSTPALPPVATTNPLTALRLTSGGLAADEVFFYKRLLSAAERTALFSVNPNGSGATNDLSFNFKLTVTETQLPQFLSGSEELSRKPGTSAAFRPIVVSATPMNYQWLHDGIVLPGKTNLLLFLGNLSPADAGEYTLAANNVAGTVTNSPSHLAVVDIPTLEGQWSANGFLLQVTGYDVTSTVLTSTNLIDWTELVSLPPNAATTNFLDLSASNAPVRFYRLRLDL